jgi:hypothetical protein
MTPVTGVLIFADPSLANRFILAKDNHFTLANDYTRIASSGPFTTSTKPAPWEDHCQQSRQARSRG